MGDTVMAVLVLIYWVIAWSSLNYLQNQLGLTFFTTIEGFMKILFLKGFISLFFGWLIIPIALIHKVLKK